MTAGLYFVATPIGAARDITLRALDILRDADVLAAEDTRNTRRLMDIHGVALNGRSLVSYHDHNGPARRPALMAALAAGKSVAYVSDAGTPLIADPGYGLAQAAIAAGHPVFAAPGASAILAALSVAGLPTDRFFFAGFAPNKTKARTAYFESLIPVPGTLIFYESPKRLGKSLTDMVTVYGADRPAVVCRELTKKFEETRRDTLGGLVEFYGSHTPKGEIVILLGPAPVRPVSQHELETALKAARENGDSLKDAVAKVTKSSGLARKMVYQTALELEDKL